LHKDDIIHGDRMFIHKHILYDVNDKVNAHLRCNSNRDGITQDDLDDTNTYPLYKLQLMFTLQNKNDFGSVTRTDCFYAPAFYNYVVEQILSQLDKKHTIIKHPLGGTPISINDINELMRIVHSIDPSIKNPALFINTHPKDEELELEIDDETEKGFYIINIVRNSLPVYLKLAQLCIIPSDIKSSEITKSFGGEYKHYSSKSFVKMLEGLFKSGKLLFTYMPPYNKNGYYVRHQDDVFHKVQDLQSVAGWQELDRDDQLNEFHNLYLSVETAFKSE